MIKKKYMNTNKKNEPVEVFSGSAWQADMVKSLLNDAEIDVYLKDEILGTIAPWWASPGGAGAVKVYVSHINYDKAKQIVEEYERNLKKK
jgi:hypothetical protein